MIKLLDELLSKYAEQFGDNFPIFVVRDKDENEIIKIIQNCLDENMPYEAEYLDDIDY
jgi:2-oxo-4-hydroxy-4-carboxy--5-ureidoimidazoline (OHCU) decarboxylase